MRKSSKILNANISRSLCERGAQQQLKSASVWLCKNGERPCLLLVRVMSDASLLTERRQTMTVETHAYSDTFARVLPFFSSPWTTLYDTYNVELLGEIEDYSDVYPYQCMWFYLGLLPFPRSSAKNGASMTT